MSLQGPKARWIFVTEDGRRVTIELQRNPHPWPGDIACWIDGKLTSGWHGNGTVLDEEYRVTARRVAARLLKVDHVEEWIDGTTSHTREELIREIERLRARYLR